MKVKSEYSLLSECVDRGIKIGYDKYQNSGDRQTEQNFYDYLSSNIMSEIAERFVFDNETVSE